MEEERTEDWGDTQGFIIPNERFHPGDEKSHVAHIHGSQMLLCLCYDISVDVRAVLITCSEVSPRPFVLTVPLIVLFTFHWIRQLQRKKKYF